MTAVIDLNATEGLFAHFVTLPDENLRAIAARPVWNAESAAMVITAGAILDARSLAKLDSTPEPYLVHAFALNAETDEYEDFTVCRRSHVSQATASADEVNCPRCLEEL